MKCPKCGSNSLHSEKRGYNAVKGVLGMLTIGGLLLGFHGSRKIEITCLSCGYKFKPGEGYSSNDTASARRETEPKSTINPSEAKLLDIYAKSYNEHLSKRGVKKTLACSNAKPPTTTANLKIVCECGVWNEMAYKFCRTCGDKLEMPKLKPIKIGQSLETQICVYCGAETPKQSRKNCFCIKCGYSYSAKTI